jgi:hypothetical protein
MRPHRIEVNVFHLFNSWIPKSKIVDQPGHRVLEAVIVSLLVKKSRADEQRFIVFEQRDPALDVALPAFWLEGIGEAIGENPLDPTFENGRHAHKPDRIDDG